MKRFDCRDECLVRKDDTFGDSGGAGCVHDDGRVELFWFDRCADLFRAHGDDLEEAVKGDAILVTRLVRRMNLKRNKEGQEQFPV